MLDVGVYVISAMGHTFLLIAAGLCDGDLVDCPLARIAPVSSKSLSGPTAVREASLAGHIAMVKRLLSAGADMVFIADNGSTALHC